ncbi:DUF3310 domain-containing protein [Lacrimispora amygdalina]|uniref:DUF3310 domain-containing protein n=2 Tax=Lacrimispora amygdalina TaxID=253257 RepID=A0A3E2NCU5_9FIRM|nr:DUF3310 domain-containing protein [Clostridium indicum]
MVNHPTHYADSCSMECFDAMKIAFGVRYVIIYCKITAFKYLWRHKHKGGEEDVRKALWYLMAADDVTGGDITADDAQYCELFKQANAAYNKYKQNKDDSVQ